jgi:hypothetical protein
MNYHIRQVVFMHLFSLLVIYFRGVLRIWLRPLTTDPSLYRGSALNSFQSMCLGSKSPDKWNNVIGSLC